MSDLIYMLLGCATGVLASLPIAWLCNKVVTDDAADRRNLSFGRAFACVLAPFLFLQVVLSLVGQLSTPSVLVFGVPATLVFLGMSTILGIRTWIGLHSRKKD